MDSSSMLPTRRMSKQVLLLLLLLVLPMMMLLLRRLSIPSLLTKTSWQWIDRCLAHVMTENSMSKAKICSETLLTIQAKQPRIMPLLVLFLPTAAILDVAPRIRRVDVVRTHSNGHRQSTTALHPPREHLQQQEGEMVVLQQPPNTESQLQG